MRCARRPCQIFRQVKNRVSFVDLCALIYDSFVAE
jgi:hypothetical protein